MDSSIFTGSIRITEDEAKHWKTLLHDFVDIQIHLAPDTVKRACDDVEFADDAMKTGYRGFLIKDHHAPSAGRAYDLRKQFPQLAIFGGIVLNHYVGGFNPDAVEAAIKLGSKQVWMPTFDAQNHFKQFGTYGLPGLTPTKSVNRSSAAVSLSNKNRGLSVFENNQPGVIRSEVKEIVSMVADAGIALGTGHISLEEIFAF
jgi:hypothetical protein